MYLYIITSLSPCFDIGKKNFHFQTLFTIYICLSWTLNQMIKRLYLYFIFLPQGTPSSGFPRRQHRWPSEGDRGLPPAREVPRHDHARVRRACHSHEHLHGHGGLRHPHQHHTGQGSASSRNMLQDQGPKELKILWCCIAAQNEGRQRPSAFCGRYTTWNSWLWMTLHGCSFSKTDCGISSRKVVKETKALSYAFIFFSGYCFCHNDC